MLVATPLFEVHQVLRSDDGAAVGDSVRYTGGGNVASTAPSMFPVSSDPHVVVGTSGVG